MVKSERDFVVFDAKTGDDLTHAVLTQIIVEQESRMGAQTLLPIPFLRQLIRFYGDSIERFVPSYLQISLETLAKEQERFRKQFAGAFTPAGRLRGLPGAGAQEPRHVRAGDGDVLARSGTPRPPAAKPGEEAKAEAPKPAQARRPGATRSPSSRRSSPPSRRSSRSFPTTASRRRRLLSAGRRAR